MRTVARVVTRLAIGLVALVSLSLLAILGYAAVESGRQVTLPTPTGPAGVGRALFDWTDPSRLDPYAPNHATHRELTVLIWYPADPVPGSATTSYLPPGWAGTLGSGGLNVLLHTPPNNIRPNAVEDAPLARGTSRYPVLVFAPGLGLQASDYTTIAEDLASHGYVVAGIDPTYSTDVVLPGGRVVRSVVKARDNADYNALVQVWADDMRFVAAQMQALNAMPGSRFLRRLRVAQMGFFGHSAGGAAATLACRHDERCSGAMDIDGDLAGDVLQSGLGKPFLFLGHANAIVKEPYLKVTLHSVLQGVPTDQGFVLTVAGTHHDNFTDRGLYFNLFSSQLGFVGSIDAPRALRITSAYLRGFLDTYLQGQASPLLTGPSSQYPDVQAVPCLPACPGRR